MAGEDHRGVGEADKLLEAVVHRRRVAAGKVGTAATFEEQGVAADQPTVHVEALAARRVPGCVHERDLHVPDAHDVAAVVGDELGIAEPGGALHPWHLGALHVHRAVAALQQLGHAFDAHAHHRAADMVGVVVGGEHAREAHPVGLDRVDQFADRICRVHQQALAGGAVADGVDEVDHLLGDRIADREVPSGQQLAEVEAVVGRGLCHPVNDTRWGFGGYGAAAMTEIVTHLEAGQPFVYAGNRVTRVSPELATSFAEGDRIVIVHATGDILHIPAAVHHLVTASVDRACVAFAELAEAADEQITAFFDAFAGNLADEARFAVIADANARDVMAAEQRNRATGRLRLDASMRAAMVAGLHTWRDAPAARARRVDVRDHGAWTVETWRSPLGVVGFVFEGRPNVFADATGVLRTGNTVVFRIGSDALGTARAIIREAVEPALGAAGLPLGAVQLVDSTAHAAGWAMFADQRLGLAVARGSGAAVAQLGAVARQHGVPASLHGTGGAWLVADETADPAALHAAVANSLDRKVCNTLNVCCVVAARAAELVEVVQRAAEHAAEPRGVRPLIHRLAPDDARLGDEFEWDAVPEFAVVVVDDTAAAVAAFNRYAPRFAASLISTDPSAHDRFFAAVDAPFVGDGFTRWVDGQFALDQPELGLSNWQGGRLLGRSGVLSGDSVHTLRLRAHIADISLHRG